MRNQKPSFHYFWKKQDLVFIVNIFIKKPASFPGDKATHSMLCSQYLQNALIWRLWNTSNCVYMDPKQQTQILIFFMLYYKTSRVFRGFGQLSSSICCPFKAGPNLPWGPWGQIIPIVNQFWFCHKLGFWAILWVTDTLASQFWTRFQNILGQKKAKLVGVPGARLTRPKAQKHHHIMTSLQKTLNPKQKNFFSISTRRLAESAEGLNSSVAQSAGEL